MPKIRTVSVRLGYTFAPQQYHSVRGEYEVIADLLDDEDEEYAQKEIRKDALNGLFASLRSVSTIEDSLATKSREEALSQHIETVEDLDKLVQVEYTGGSEVISLDDDGDLIGDFIDWGSDD